MIRLGKRKVTLFQLFIDILQHSVQLVKTSINLFDMLFGSCQFLHLLYYQQNSYQQNNREETYDYQQEPKPILLFFTVKLVRLIYDWKYYNASKLEITHYDFSDVKFTSSFSKEWFEVPPGFKVKIASSASEAREIYISDVEAARPSWINRFSARIGSVLGNVFSWNWIFQYGAYLAISIGILCIAGIVVIKRKKR